MQHFINNWTATLLAPMSASDVEMQVDPALAAKLVGLDEGGFYLVTVAEKDSLGKEVAWEVIKVTAKTGGSLTVVREQEGTEAAPTLPAGTEVSARLTTGTMQALATAGGGGALTKENFAEKLVNNASGKGGNIAYFDSDIGELLFVEVPLEFPWLTSAAPLNPGTVVSIKDVYELTASGAAAGLSLVEGQPALSTGSSESGNASLKIVPVNVSPTALEKLGVPFPLAAFDRDTDIKDMIVSASIRIESLSYSGEYFSVSLNFVLPGLTFNLEYDSDYYGGNWVIAYTDADNNYVEFDTGRAVAAAAATFVARVVSVASVQTLKIEKDGVELLAVPLANIDVSDPARLSVTARISKFEGTTNRRLWLYQAFGKVTLN